VPDVEAQFSPPDDDPLRSASPSVDDMEARRARAAIEGRLFAGRPSRIKVGRYRVEGRIGAGGMGVVYRAHDPELARDVAVKVMNTQAVTDEQARLARARLVREARAMARLAHPNVIHVYDVGTVEDGVFIAMELVEGTSLDVWLAEEPRPWQEILRRFIDAGRGLAAAHDAGVVHRDFKPENVLMGDDGRVRVCDFGLAGGPASETTVPDANPADSGAHGELDSTDVGASLTRTGTLLGTPKYMAPEQELGSDVTERSDQFSFCVALHEALYGSPPYDGKTVASYRVAVRHGDVLPPPADTQVPSWIHDCILKGLQVEPEDRHVSMSALLDRLEEALADPRAGMARQRQRRWVGAGLAGTVALAGTLFALSFDRDEGSTTPAQPEVRTIVAEADPPAPDEEIRAVIPAEDTKDPPPPTPAASGEHPDEDAEAGEPPHDSAAEDATVPPIAKRTKPPARPRKSGRTCYFLQDKYSWLGESKGARSTLLRDQSCYVCRVARRTDTLSAPDGEPCRAYRICARETPDKCEG
jgi:serine/threonine protein kinase